jgi:hypothetical protein
MLERGDLLALHEPLEGIMHFGHTEVQGQQFVTPMSLLSWLLDDTDDINVFLKETTNRRVFDIVLTERRLLAEARHAFLIRHPGEIAASFYAVAGAIREQDPRYPEMRLESIGLETLYELYAAVCEFGGHRPVVIDSDDLVARPEATMAAYCSAVELPFVPEALQWEPGERPEWRRTARWHADVTRSSGFEEREQRYAHTVETSDGLAGFAAHHLPFYERLHAQRLSVGPE